MNVHTCQDSRKMRGVAGPYAGLPKIVDHKALQQLGAEIFRVQEAAGLGDNQKAFAKALGKKDQSTISKIVSAKAAPSQELLNTIAEKYPEIANLEKMRRLLARAKGWYVEATSDTPARKPTRKKGHAPVVGQAHAGPWIAAIAAPQEETDWIPLPPGVKASQRLFWVRVEGDSMNKAGILPGDLLLVDPDATAEHGEKALCIYGLGDEAVVTIKFFRSFAEMIVLEPSSTNSKHKAQTFSVEEWDHNGGKACRILGSYGFRK